LHIDELRSYFEEGEVFKTKDITTFYRQFEEGVKKTTINWRVHELVQKGVLQRIGRGTFKLGTQKQYVPDISSQLKTIYQKIDKEFPFLDLCIWSTSALNEFMIHQPFRFFTLVEVDKEATSSVFHYLKDHRSAVFLEPGEEVLEYYLPEDKNAYIVHSLVSEAPVIEVKGVTCATLEKILVDIFCDPITFSAYQGSERSTIFKEAFNKYTVNRNKLLRYANRRGKKEELSKYLESFKLLATNND